jgi:hypothetical protein
MTQHQVAPGQRRKAGHESVEVPCRCPLGHVMTDGPDPGPGEGVVVLLGNAVMAGQVADPTRRPFLGLGRPVQPV